MISVLLIMTITLYTEGDRALVSCLRAWRNELNKHMHTIHASTTPLCTCGLGEQNRMGYRTSLLGGMNYSEGLLGYKGL